MTVGEKHITLLSVNFTSNYINLIIDLTNIDKRSNINEKIFL